MNPTLKQVIQLLVNLKSLYLIVNIFECNNLNLFRIIIILSHFKLYIKMIIIKKKYYYVNKNKVKSPTYSKCTSQISV